MTTSNYTTRTLADFTNEDLITLLDEPEFLATRTPLELELIVRLGAMHQASQRIENELQQEINRLAAYEPEQAKVEHLAALNQRFTNTIHTLTPRANVTVAIQ